MIAWNTAAACIAACSLATVLGAADATAQKMRKSTSRPAPRATIDPDDVHGAPPLVDSELGYPPARQGEA